MQKLTITDGNRAAITQAFADVPVVDIGIRCALEDTMGTVYADDADHPRFYMIDQDGFFMYHAGDFSSDDGRAFLKATPGGRLLMSGSPGWADALTQVFDAENLMPITRHSFDSDAITLDRVKGLAENSPHASRIKRIDADLINTDIPFLEIGAYGSNDNFLANGIGFCMLHNDASVGVAYASLRCRDAIEVSIVVDENHRRKGIATTLAAHLLMWCLENNLRANWDAANDESCSLAKKLGYTNQRSYTAYFLK